MAKSAPLPPDSFLQKTFWAKLWETTIEAGFSSTVSLLPINISASKTLKKVLSHSKACATL
jgi:hypothetical protein